MPRKNQSESPEASPPAPGGFVAAAESIPEGIPLVERAIAVSGTWPGRIPNSSGKPGGLIELPPGRRPIIVGDLHANLDYLKRIIDHQSNRADLDAGRACMVIVGDSIHDDRTGYMKQMQSSVETLDFLLRLLVERPKSVYYIRGNHDTFDSRLRKSGISQGLEFRAALVAAHGEAYVEAVSRFFDLLPMFVIGQGFVVTHAGPPRGGLVREELVDIDRYPEKYHQLMWNRVNEFHGNPSPKEYGEQDLRLVLDQLGMPPDTHFIVGHNPLWNDGNRDGVWLDVIGIRNHHIIYSGSGSRAPYFTTEDGKLLVRFAVEREPEVYYYG